MLLGAVPPLMVKTPDNPSGTPIEVFDDFRAQLAANRAQFYLDVPSGPFYGFNRLLTKSSEAVIRNWWRQGMMGGAKAHYDGIKAFSETDFTEDLKAIEVPTLERPVKVKVPAGSQCGRVLRLKGRGVERGKTTGDLLVELRVTVPTTLNDDARAAVEALQSATAGDDPRRELARRAAW